MKHVALFDGFMRDTVNLNQSRISTLESRVRAIQSYLEGSSYDAPIQRFSAQGSWAHKTIIKPANSNTEFDADLVMFVGEHEDWEPKDYIEQLFTTFRGSGTYRDKVFRGSRCVTVDYANDFHLDVVPCIQRESFWNDTSYHVTNRVTNEEEETASEAYTEWLDDLNQTTGKNMLRKVIRLLKYQRDVKKTFSAKSILLTTLVGMQVSSLDVLFRSIYYPDLPSALKTLVGRLDDWLQERPDVPTVRNPALTSEDFNRHWDQTKYNNFRNMISKYRGWIDDAYEEEDRFESLRKWRAVFGDAFAKNEVSEAASSADLSLAKSAFDSGLDLVARVRNGLISLAEIPIWPHAEKPAWRRAKQQIKIKVSATIHEKEGSPSLGNLITGQPTRKRICIRFWASSPAGIPDTFSVKWRVVNSGKEALSAHQGRGGFENSQNGNIRWEHTQYRGVHWVEAFVINRRTDECMGVSERFFVVVE